VELILAIAGAFFLYVVWRTAARVHHDLRIRARPPFRAGTAQRIRARPLPLLARVHGHPEDRHAAGAATVNGQEVIE